MAHILLVHHHPTIRYAVTAYLERLGHTVATAPRARFALESAGPEVDIVLTDIAMPGTDGVGLIEVLRERDVFAPVILMSGRFPNAVEAASAAFVLLKPFGPDELGRAIERVLDERSPLGQLPERA